MKRMAAAAPLYEREGAWTLGAAAGAAADAERRTDAPLALRAAAPDDPAKARGLH